MDLKLLCFRPAWSISDWLRAALRWVRREYYEKRVTHSPLSTAELQSCAERLCQSPARCAGPSALSCGWTSQADCLRTTTNERIWVRAVSLKRAAARRMSITSAGTRENILRFRNKLTTRTQATNTAGQIHASLIRQFTSPADCQQLEMRWSRGEAALHNCRVVGCVLVS